MRSMHEVPSGVLAGTAGRYFLRIHPCRKRLLAVAAALVTATAGSARGGERRIAVWGFSAAAGDEEGASLGERLAVLTEVELARHGAEVVERRGFERVLTEHKVAFTQFADARKAARAGELVRADVVLVGSVLKARRQEGRIVTMKAVDTKSGKVLDARAAWVPPQGIMKCAKYAADLVLAARRGKLAERVFIAIGGFEDLSMSDRFADLGGKIRAGLVDEFSKDAAFTVLEREHVEPLLLELGLSKSALAAPGFGETDAVPAFVMVDGLYQTYHKQRARVRLNVRLESPGRRSAFAQFDEPSGRVLCRRIAEEVRKFVAQRRKRSGREPQPTVTEAKLKEAELHFERGCEQSRIAPRHRSYFECPMGGTLGGYPRRGNPGQKKGTPYQRRISNLRDAASSFESALLLNPQHHFAKLFLTACLMDPDVGEFERARQLLRGLAAEARGEREGQLALLFLGGSYFVEGMEKKPRPGLDRFSDAVAADFRAAIRIWSRLLGELESFADREEAQRSIYHTAACLHRAGRMPVAEYAAQIEAMIRVHCGAAIEKPGSADAEYFQVGAFWRELAKVHGQDAWERCLALERELSGRYPSFSYALRFSLAEAFGLKEDHLQIVEGVLKELLQRPERLTGRNDVAVDILPKAAIFYAKLGRRDNALFYAEHLEILLDGQMRGKVPEVHRVRAKALLAYCLEGVGRLEEAVRVYEELGQIEIYVGRASTWGEVFGESIVVREALDRCRAKLGVGVEPRVVPTVPLEGHLAVSLNQFDRWGGVSALAVVGETLWIGTGPPGRRVFPACAVDAKSPGWLYRCADRGGRSLGCKSFREPLPAWVTSICPAKRSVFVGTFGAGLYEFDEHGRAGKRWTHEDGLIDDRVSCLAVAGSGRLWVGFARRRQGGLGALDLIAKRFESYSPLLHWGTLRSPRDPTWPDPNRYDFDRPPGAAVTCMARDSDGGMWVAVYRTGLKHYEPRGGKWDTATDRRDFGGEKMPAGGHFITDGHCALTCVAVARRRLDSGGAEGDLVAVGAVVTGWSGRSFQAGCVDIYDVAARKWSHIRRADGLPDANVYSLAFQGEMLWIGGKGYVAAYDTRASRLVRIYTVPEREEANVLCVDGRTLWIGAGKAVYRIGAE